MRVDRKGLNKQSNVKAGKKRALQWNFGDTNKQRLKHPEANACDVSVIDIVEVLSTYRLVNLSFLFNVENGIDDIQMIPCSHSRDIWIGKAELTRVIVDATKYLISRLSCRTCVWLFLSA